MRIHAGCNLQYCAVRFAGSKRLVLHKRILAIMDAGKDQTRYLNSSMSNYEVHGVFLSHEVYRWGNVAMPTRSHGKKKVDKPAAKQPRKKDATVKQDLVVLSSRHIWIPKSIV